MALSPNSDSMKYFLIIKIVSPELIRGSDSEQRDERSKALFRKKAFERIRKIRELASKSRQSLN